MATRRQRGKKAATKVRRLTEAGAKKAGRLARTFLRDVQDEVSEESSIRVTVNANRTVDGELKVRIPEYAQRDIDEVRQLLLAYEQVIDAVGPAHLEVNTKFWLSLVGGFKAVRLKWRAYQLGIFGAGLSRAEVGTVRLVHDDAEVWATFRQVVADVFNCYQEPHPRTGRLRPVYALHQVLIRVHRGPKKPVY